jgi:hypothetical protein
LQVDGGELEVLGAVTGAGEIDLRDATARFTGGLTLSSGGRLAVTGGDVDVFGVVSSPLGTEVSVVGGAHAVFHGATTLLGDVFVALGSELSLLEDLSFVPSSQLSVQLNSPSEAQTFAPIAVAGQATLAGELNIDLGSSFTPQLGDEFEVLTALGGLTGTFSTESLPALTSGLAWDVDYDSQSVTLQVVAGPGGGTADFDGDGDVDGADLTRWRNNFGAAGSATNAQGDADGDADVDGSDFLNWQRQVGTTPPAAAAAAAIPEPAAASMLLAVAIASFAARRRQ